MIELQRFYKTFFDKLQGYDILLIENDDVCTIEVKTSFSKTHTNKSNTYNKKMLMRKTKTWLLYNLQWRPNWPTWFPCLSYHKWFYPCQLSSEYFMDFSAFLLCTFIDTPLAIVKLITLCKYCEIKLELSWFVKSARYAFIDTIYQISNIRVSYEWQRKLPISISVSKQL